MIDLSNTRNIENIKKLFIGLWDAELPNIFEIEKLAEKLPDALSYINKNNDEKSYYKKDTDGFIESFNLKNNSPDYIHKEGSEAITYYGFKNNGSWREMQISNLILYLAFISNTIYTYDSLFKKLYNDDEFEEIIKSSNSYLISGDRFLIHAYEDEPYEEGIFLIGNSKKNINIYAENKKRLLKAEDTYIYSLKIDIESFYPNIYTHYLGKISKREPFSGWKSIDKYFDFLDKYSMKINSNQTKGIPAGAYSSSISSELLMLCVDYDIRNKILGGENNIGYSRYVDDLTFFGDSKYELEEIVPKVQKVLNDYRLRINGFKTEATECVMIKQQANKYEIYSNLSFLDISDQTSFEFKIDYFYSIKAYVVACIEKDRNPQIKTLFTKLKKILIEHLENRSISEEEADVLELLFNYMIKIVWKEQKLTYHCYTLIEKILSILSDRNKEKVQNLCGKLKEKLSLIEKIYPDTIIQIWHYFVMLKYLSKEEKEGFLESKKILNPIIVSMFVEKGDDKNSKVFNYIKARYEESCSQSQGNWKSTIMLSKWWLPIFKIRINDNKNYHGLMESGNFPKVLDKLADGIPF